MTEGAILELLRSGDFTIAYHDYAAPCLYKGKLEYDDLPEKELLDLGGFQNGYIPEVVYWLVKALNGETETI